MALSDFHIGQRVNISGRGSRMFVVVDFDHNENKIRVTELIHDELLGGETNGDTEWVSADLVQKAAVVYTQFQYFSSIQNFKERYAFYESKAKPDCKAELARINNQAKNAIRTKNSEWFPYPQAYLPRNLEEMAKKTAWNEAEMEHYFDFKRKYLDDFIHELKFTSLAEVEQDKFVYNDRQLGEFDFAKASIGLNKRFQYYSPTHEKVVPFDEVDILGDEGNYEYKLKSDGTPVVIQEEKDAQGRTKYYSTVKKCYLMKEKVPRPKNAVRIFMYQGGSGSVSGDGVMFPSMTAIALTEILEFLGYSVSFISGWDACQYKEGRPVRTGINKGTLDNPSYVKGERYVMYSVKKFEDNLNLPELLYLTASYPLYAWEFWKGMYLTFDHYGDKWEDVGYLGSFSNWRQSVFSTFLPRDVNKGVMYITIRGIRTVEDVKRQVREVIQYCETVNEREREKLIAQGKW